MRRFVRRHMLAATRERALRRAALTLVALAVASGLLWLAVAIVNDLTGLKRDLVAAKRDIAVARDRIARLERRIESADVLKPAEPEAKAGPRAAAPSLQLGAQAVQLLREFIKVPPPPPGTKPAFSVGAPIAAAVLLPVPQQIADKAPELEGTRFTTDKDGSIIIVAKGSRRVDVIVPPN